MAEELERTLREIRDKLVSNPVSPRVEDAADINLHYCRYVAETVVENVGDEIDVDILEDGGRGFAHAWITHDGCHYDAECVEGVDDHLDLPFFQRHPEAAIHVEPATVDPATLRQRDKEPLYPDIFTFESPSESIRVSRSRYWKLVLACVLLGGVLIGVGLIGEWALNRDLIHQSTPFRTLFTDLEIIGELILLVSPIVFFWLLPAHRADSYR